MWPYTRTAIQQPSPNETTTSQELKRPAPPIDWLIDYERRADARQAAWEASSFSKSVRTLFGNKGTP
jgi:hypothetical protein